MTPQIRAFYDTRSRLQDASDHDGELAQFAKERREARSTLSVTQPENIDELLAYVMAAVKALEDDHPASARRANGNSIFMARAALNDAAGALCVIRNSGWGDLQRAR